MQNLFKLIKEQVNSGEAVVFVSIIASTGSVPRAAGAHMVVGKNGRVCGTIGGGMIEKRSEEAAMQMLQEEASREIHFILSDKDIQDLGMVCGGDATVFFQYIPAYDEYTVMLAEKIMEAADRNDSMWMVSDLNNGGSLSLITKDGVIGKPLLCPEQDFREIKPKRLTGDSYDYYTEQILHSGKVLIFGCGHIGQELEHLLSRLDFSCVVLDDRREFADSSKFSSSANVRVVDFERIYDFVEIQPDDFVCIMTRGHAFDAIILAQVLDFCPRYVGMIGSRAKVARVREFLKEKYHKTEEELDQVVSPIGLPIGGSTPAEIAVSIAAQLIMVRAEKII